MNPEEEQALIFLAEAWLLNHWTRAYQSCGSATVMAAAGNVAA